MAPKRKRRRLPKRKVKVEDDICFVCFDGGTLQLCQTSGCGKGYHMSCAGRDEKFFKKHGHQWSCSWHICDTCEKAARLYCHTCVYSLCKNCPNDEISFIRGTKGICKKCISHIKDVESELDPKHPIYSFMVLFKEYWEDLKKKTAFNYVELAQMQGFPTANHNVDGDASGAILYRDVHGTASTSVLPAKDVCDNVMENIKVNQPPLADACNVVTGVRSAAPSHHEVENPSAFNMVQTETILSLTHGVSPTIVYQGLLPCSSLKHHDVSVSSSTAVFPGESDAIIMMDLVEGGTPFVAGAVSAPMNLSMPTVSLCNQEVECQSRLFIEDEANGLGGSTTLVEQLESLKRHKGSELGVSTILSCKEISLGHEAYGFGGSAASVLVQASSKRHEANDTQGCTPEGSSKPIGLLSYTRKKDKGRLKSPAKEDCYSCKSIPRGTEWASKELLDFVVQVKKGDRSVMSYFEVQALFLEYIKRKNLRNPDWKNQIICDSRLENLFKKDRIMHFELLRDLETHLISKAEAQINYTSCVKFDFKRAGSEGEFGIDTGRTVAPPKRRKTEVGSASQLITNELEHSPTVQDPLELHIDPKIPSKFKSKEDGPESNGKEIQGSTLSMQPKGSSEEMNEPQKQGSERSEPFHEPAHMPSSISEAEKVWHYQDPSGVIQGPFSMEQFCYWSTRYFPANLRIWRTTEKQEESMLMRDALDGKFREVSVSSSDIRADGQHVDPNKKDDSFPDNSEDITPIRSVNFAFGNNSIKGGVGVMQQSSGSDQFGNSSRKGRSKAANDVVASRVSNCSGLGTEGEYEDMQQSEKSNLGTTSDFLLHAFSSIPGEPASGDGNSFSSLQEWHYQDSSGEIKGPFSMAQFRRWSTSNFPAKLRIWRTVEKQEDSILMTDALDGNFSKVSVSSCAVGADTENGANKKNDSSPDNGETIDSFQSAKSTFESNLSEKDKVLEKSPTSGQVGRLNRNSHSNTSNDEETNQLGASEGTNGGMQQLRAYSNYIASLGCRSNYGAENQQVVSQSLKANQSHAVVDSLEHQFFNANSPILMGVSGAVLDHISKFTSPSRIAHPDSLSCVRSSDGQEPPSGNQGSSHINFSLPGFPSERTKTPETLKSSNALAPVIYDEQQGNLEKDWGGNFTVRRDIMVDSGALLEANKAELAQPRNWNTGRGYPQENIVDQRYTSWDSKAMQQDNNGKLGWAQPVQNTSRWSRDNSNLKRLYNHPVHDRSSFNRQSRYGNNAGTGREPLGASTHNGQKVCNFHGRGRGCWNGANCSYLHI